MEDEDAWGPELDSEHITCHTPGPSTRFDNSSRGTKRNPKAQLGEIPPESNVKSVQLPSLRSICLGVVGLHLEELIESGGDTVLPCLPSDARISLLAVARRRGWVDERTLPMFLDETWPMLDIANTGLKASVIEGVADKLPNLQAVDLSGNPQHIRFQLSLSQKLLFRYSRKIGSSSSSELVSSRDLHDCLHSTGWLDGFINDDDECLSQIAYWGRKLCKFLDIIVHLWR